MDSKQIITLFITDDDEDDRDFIKTALSQRGFNGHFLQFENGDELISYLAAHPASAADIILLDLNMPVKDGYDTLKELKGDEKLKDIPVIILTSSSKEEDEQYCYRLGCNNFVRKPLSVRGYEMLASDIIAFSSGGSK